ncbi:50S ribosomal protein L15 [Candidatus Microgenomates bacterium]|nr:50S ribosomal protein L15 [Candidatus Microgenomates bacterium]
MKLNSLPKIKARSKKRLGLGHGSGRGKTAGRGTKGQKARGKIPLRFEGGALSIIKRLPFKRGRGRNRVFKKKPIAVNVKVLNILPKNTVVDLKTLVSHKIVDQEQATLYGVKILGEGTLTVPLTVKIRCSKGAEKKITKAGGKVAYE